MLPDLVPALRDYYDRHMSDGTFVSWLAKDGEKIVGTSGMSFVYWGPLGPGPGEDRMGEDNTSNLMLNLTLNLLRLKV